MVSHLASRTGQPRTASVLLHNSAGLAYTASVRRAGDRDAVDVLCRGTVFVPTQPAVAATAEPSAAAVGELNHASGLRAEAFLEDLMAERPACAVAVIFAVVVGEPEAAAGEEQPPVGAGARLIRGRALEKLVHVARHRRHRLAGRSERKRARALCVLGEAGRAATASNAKFVAGAEGVVDAVVIRRARAATLDGDEAFAPSRGPDVVPVARADSVDWVRATAFEFERRVALPDLAAGIRTGATVACHAEGTGCLWVGAFIAGANGRVFFVASCRLTRRVRRALHSAWRHGARQARPDPALVEPLLVPECPRHATTRAGVKVVPERGADQMRVRSALRLVDRRVRVAGLVDAPLLAACKGGEIQN